MTTNNGIQQQAITDGIATTRKQLEGERRALLLCEAMGYTTDAAFARKEIAHYEAALLALYQRAGHNWAVEFGMRDEPPQEVLDLIASGELDDNSWHNDVCPSFYHRNLPPLDADGNDVRLWCHPAKPEDREYDCPRFNVSAGVETLIQTDNVRAAIEVLRAEARKRGFPNWTSYHTGGGCMALRRDFPGGAHALLTQPDDQQEPTDPTGPIFLGIYHADDTFDNACAVAFRCRNLGHVEDILDGLELIGETGVEPVPDQPRTMRPMAVVSAEAAVAAADRDDDAPEDDDDADPNDCAECARQFGPHYTGRCTH